MLTKDYRIIPDLRGRILVVDSDTTICDMMRVHFSPNGFSVDYCTSYEDLRPIEIGTYVLIIISLDLGETENATGIVERIRQRQESAATGIITCSANMSPTRVIHTLNAGADDYLLVPFSQRELMARTRAVLRRYV